MNDVPAIIRKSVLFAVIGLVSSCQPVTDTMQQRQLALELKWQQQAVSCQTFFSVANQQWQLQKLRLYLSDFSLNQQPLALADNRWQQSRLAMLGTDCQGNDNWQLQFAEPLVSGELSFTVGLPFAVNHQNPLTASSPLNHSDMFWSWQLGYKFLRLDVQGPQQGFAFHLGSTGCQSASVLRPPALPCKAANTFNVTLDYQPGQSLQVDLALLLQHVELASDNSCMSDSQQASCEQLFNNLAQSSLWTMVSNNE